MSFSIEIFSASYKSTRSITFCHEPGLIMTSITHGDINEMVRKCKEAGIPHVSCGYDFPGFGVCAGFNQHDTNFGSYRWKEV